jgi:hypothetical protein
MPYKAGLPSADQKLPVVPVRQASLQKKWSSECDIKNHDSEVSCNSPSSSCSTDSGQSYRQEPSKGSRSPKSRSCGSDVGSSGDSETFLRNRGSFGRDGLKSLFPDLTDLISDSYDRRGKGTKSMSTTAKGKGKKDTGRWAWASWF